METNKVSVTFKVGYSKGQGEILLKSEWFLNPCQAEKSLGDCQIMLVGTEMTDSIRLME